MNQQTVNEQTVNEQIMNEQVVSQQKNINQTYNKVDNSKGLFTFFSKSKNNNNQEEGNIQQMEQNEESQLFRRLNMSQSRLLDRNMNLMKEF